MKCDTSNPNGSDATSAVENPAIASQAAELDKFVSGPRLLEILWDEDSRPTLRWLRTQTKKRAIPFARSAGRVWFIPRKVREAMTRLEIRRGRPRIDLTDKGN